MIIKFLSALKIALSFHFYKRGDLQKARQYLDGYFKLKKSSDPVAVAFDATLMVLERRRESAKIRFQEASTISSSLSTEDAIYLFEYCKYYECLISDMESCDHHRARALGSGASKFIRKYLSLAEVNVG